MFVISCVVHLFDVCKDIHCWKWYFCLFLSLSVWIWDEKVSLTRLWEGVSLLPHQRLILRHDTTHVVSRWTCTSVDGGTIMQIFCVGDDVVMCIHDKIGTRRHKKGTIKGDMYAKRIRVSSHTKCKKKVSCLIIFWIHLIKFWILFRAPFSSTHLIPTYTKTTGFRCLLFLFLFRKSKEYLTIINKIVYRLLLYVVARRRLSS